MYKDRHLSFIQIFFMCHIKHVSEGSILLSECMGNVCYNGPAHISDGQGNTFKALPIYSFLFPEWARYKVSLIPHYQRPAITEVTKCFEAELGIIKMAAKSEYATTKA